MKEDDGFEQQAGVTTILDNLIELDQLLDENSRRALGVFPYLELSKYVRIRKGELTPR